MWVLIFWWVPCRFSAMCSMSCGKQIARTHACWNNISGGKQTRIDLYSSVAPGTSGSCARFTRVISLDGINHAQDWSDFDASFHLLRLCHCCCSLALAEDEPSRRGEQIRHDRALGDRGDLQVR